MSNSLTIACQEQVVYSQMSNSLTIACQEQVV